MARRRVDYEDDRHHLLAEVFTCLKAPRDAAATAYTRSAVERSPTHLPLRRDHDHVAGRDAAQRAADGRFSFW